MPYKCEICYHNFESKPYLNGHIAAVHNAKKSNDKFQKGEIIEVVKQNIKKRKNLEKDEEEKESKRKVT